MRFKLLTGDGSEVHRGNHSTPGHAMIWVDERGTKREFTLDVVNYPPGYTDDPPSDTSNIEITYREKC